MSEDRALAAHPAAALLRPVYFVSDLHLAAARPAPVEVFLRFLQAEAATAGAVYILGDLFEYWVGDDDRSDPVVERVCAGIAETVSRGVPVFFAHGNRDFLLGKAAAARAKMRLLGEQTTINLFGRRTLITHGDELCTADRAYQRYRQRIRTPWVMRALAGLPLSVRRAIARSLRARSERDKRGKPAEIMDVSPLAVDAAMRLHDATLIIHGHTHRPGAHRFLVNGRECERIALADWYEHGSALRAIGDRLDAITLY